MEKVKNILVTGAAGFIGKNLIAGLNSEKADGIEIFPIDIDNSKDEVDNAVDNADIIFHLAGVNRPKDEKEFFEGNTDFTGYICQRLLDQGKKAKIVFTSSIQAELDNPYGKSKVMAEKHLSGYAEKSGAPVVVYRLHNIFGKWCRPNYNSVVATFCYNIANDKPISISDPSNEIALIYIDDLVGHFMDEISSASERGVSHKQIENRAHINLGDLSDIIYSFKNSRNDLIVPDFSQSFIRSLYATYLSYLPENGFAYLLDKKEDNRGSLAEFIKTTNSGQIFVSRTKPGITRGDHYHHTKTEKFLVLEGQAIIRFRQISGDEILEYKVDGRDYKVVDIPPGYTHSIENVGKGELIVLFWASEQFDPENPDTFYSKVIHE